MRLISEIVSYILITLLVVSLISFILSWGLPYLQKKQDEMKVNLIFNSLFSEGSSASVPSVLKNILITKTAGKVGGYEGVWNVSANFITFSFISRTSPINSANWITIYGCAKNLCEFLLEPFYEIQVRSERVNGRFVVFYRIILKDIIINGQAYKIMFENSLYSNTKYIFLSFSRIDEFNKIIYLKVQ